MEIEDKDYTMDDIVDFVNSQEGEFILRITWEGTEDEHKGSV